MFLWSHRNFAELADDGGVTFIVWMDGHRAIAQHGFGAGGGDADIVAHLAQGDVAVFVFFDVFIFGPACQRVFEMPHVAVNLDILDLEVRDCGFEMRVPVDQPFAAIDQAFVIKIDENLEHGVVEVFIHGKGVAIPVTGCAKAFELVDNGRAVFLFPLPDLFNERLAAHVGAGWQALFGQHLFDLQLGGDTGVVLSGLPQGVMAAHPVPAHQHILQGVVKGMTDVQRAGDIGRRDHDGKGFRALFGIRACLKGAAAFPSLVNPRLGRCRIKVLFHRHISRPA